MDRKTMDEYREWWELCESLESCTMDELDEWLAWLRSPVAVKMTGLASYSIPAIEAEIARRPEGVRRLLRSYR